MEFKTEKRERPAKIQYPQEEFETARKFAKAIYKELGEFIKGVVLFGSVTKSKQLEKEADIDLLVILDDLRIKFSEELVHTYRIIIEKVVADIDPKRLHIQSMKFTSFWEYIRAGDPVAINILRYGVALIDTGFFDPLQALLDQGRIRPSKESVYTYYVMAPASLHRAKQHILTAMTDLYWATIDAAHAALMEIGEIPPSPEHVADLLYEKMAKKGLIKRKNVATMRDLYRIFKDITHREIKEVDGKEYDNYRKRVNNFVNDMRKFIEKKKK